MVTKEQMIIINFCLEISHQNKYSIGNKFLYMDKHYLVYFKNLIVNLREQKKPIKK